MCKGKSSYVEEQGTTGRCGLGVMRSPLYQWVVGCHLFSSLPYMIHKLKRVSYVRILSPLIRQGRESYASPMSEKGKTLAGREPTTYGFEGDRPTNIPLRPVVFSLLSAIYDL